MRIKQLIVVVGPTGSGKTDLSIRPPGTTALRSSRPTPRQFYRGLAIGIGAADRRAQLQAAEHHFIASHAVDDDINCGSYEVQARLPRTALRTARPGDRRRRLGTLRAGFVRGDGRSAASRRGLRGALMRRLEDERTEASPRAAPPRPGLYEQVDRRNPARVVRALEVCLQTGRPAPNSGRAGIANALSGS